MPYYARRHQLAGNLVYHVLNRSNGRARIFHDDEDYRQFLDIIMKYTMEKGIKIYHYCIMPNHYHLLLEILEPELLSITMANINRLYSVYHHKRCKTSGYLWQGRFKSKPVQKDEYMLGCARYIERNPVSCSMVARAEEYPYSSAPYYAIGTPDGLICKDPLYEEFGRGIDDKRRSYQDFLLDFDSKEEKIYNDFTKPLGDSNFRCKLFKQNGHYIPRRKGRRLNSVKAKHFSPNII